MNQMPPLIGGPMRSESGRRFRLGVPAILFLLISFCAAQQTTFAQDGSAILAAIETATTSAIEKAERSVVAIARLPKKRDGVGNRAQLNPLSLDSIPLLEDPFRDPNFVPTFFGSGVILSEDGFIVTCAHVLGDPRQNDYLVWLDRRSYSATVIGPPVRAITRASDGFSDLAVLKINASGLEPIEFGETDSLKRGKFVIALGNPDAIARDGQASASWGIVSNLGRIAPGKGVEDEVRETVHQFGTLIQTDAKLNFGTSGGALIDLKGKMIGLTTSLAARTGVENSAGYAIATDQLFKQVISNLRLGKLPEFGFLGIQPEDLRSRELERGLRGAKVSAVLPGLPGEEAGLRSQDIIIQVDDQPIQNRNDLFRELSVSTAGTPVRLVVHRFRPGKPTPMIVRLEAELSKKPVLKSPLTYTQKEQTVWRGMVVEYITAIPSELTRFGVWRGRRGAPKVAVLSVEPGTPAWNAGVRAGNGIAAVNRNQLSSPDEFYRLVEDSTSPVELQIVRNNGTPAKLQISSDADLNSEL